MRVRSCTAWSKLRRESVGAIARDLHDHLGQQLTALRLKLESIRSNHADSPTLVDEIKSTQEIASRVDRDVNFLSWELRPTELEELGLRDALGSFIREWSMNYKINPHFQAGNGFNARLGETFETNIYRIVQEGLNNILKHADAKNVEVLLNNERIKLS